MKKTAKSALAPAQEQVRVYCGPTVKGVCKQFTVYAGELPLDMEQYVSTRPGARALLVNPERFPEVRKNLNEQGSAEAILYQELLTE